MTSKPANTYALLLCLLFLLLWTGFCAAKTNENNHLIPESCLPIFEKTLSFGVCRIGTRLGMFKQNALGGVFSLDQLPKDAGFVAVGPIENLKGEITLYDGQLYLSSLDKNFNEITVSPKQKSAIFLGLGYARDWQPIVIPQELDGLDEIEAFVAAQSRLVGIRETEAFPFKIEGRATHLVHHVIFKDNTLPHTKALHQQAKFKFENKNETVKIAGIYSSNDQVGHITHPGKRTHLHVITDSQSGHLDAITLTKGSTLFLPVVNE